MYERIAAISHVTGLCLHANSVIGNRDVSAFHSSWADCDHRHVLVRTLWDNPILYEEVIARLNEYFFCVCVCTGYVRTNYFGLLLMCVQVGYPMYVLWNKNDKESDLLSALLTDNTTIPRR